MLLTHLTLDDQADGQPVSLSSTPGWGTIGTGAIVARDTAATHGPLGAALESGAFGALRYQGIADSTVVIDFYCRVRASGGEINIANARTSGGSAAHVRRDAGGTITLRDGANAAWTSTGTILADATVYRIAWRLSPAGQHVRVYQGEATTPVIDSGVQPLTETAIAEARVGITSASAGSVIDVDEVRIATDWLVPINPEPAAAARPIAYTITAGARRPLLGYRVIGGERHLVNPAATVESLTQASLLMLGGGTHNSLAYSPDGGRLVAGADVGGTRVCDTATGRWTYRPTDGANASRQVAGAIITDDGTIYQAVGGGGTSGMLQRIAPDGAVTTLAAGLDIRGNDISDGDSVKRPRPVGWMLGHDPVRACLWVATEGGIGRYDLGSSTWDGIVSLPGESIRCIGHGSDNSGQVSGQYVYAGTRTQGVRRINADTNATSAIGGPTRVEDIAVLDGGALVVAAHQAGFHRYDGTTWTDVSPAGSAGSTAVSVAIAPSGQVAAGVLFPQGGAWVYLSPTGQAGTWRTGTPAPGLTEAGLDITPANRTLGYDYSGSWPAGVWCLAYHPHRTGDLVAAGPLSVWRTTTAGSTAPSWGGYNRELSVVSVTEVDVHDGRILMAVADHDGYETGSRWDAPTHISVGGLSGGFSVAAHGSGPDRVQMLAPGDSVPGGDTQSGNDVVYRRGTGAWTTTGWNSSLDGAGPLSSGQRPRPMGLHLYGSGGTYRAVAWADHLGWVSATYTLATDSWSSWSVMTSGPTANLVCTVGQNNTAQIEGSDDGTVLVAVQLPTGDLWRSLDHGDTWTQITPEVGTAQDVRTGRVAIAPDGSWAIASDGTGLWRIANPGGSATATRIMGITDPCVVAIDPAGAAYAHVRKAGPGELWRWADYATATSTATADQIGTDEYRARWADGASCISVGIVDGALVGVTGYQGAGAAWWRADL